MNIVKSYFQCDNVCMLCYTHCSDEMAGCSNLNTHCVTVVDKI